MRIIGTVVADGTVPLTTREDELRHALRGLEWAGTIWTDTAVCLFCGNLRDGANLKNPPETYPPRTHKANCEWKRLTETY